MRCIVSHAVVSRWCIDGKILITGRTHLAFPPTTFDATCFSYACDRLLTEGGRNARNPWRYKIYAFDVISGEANIGLRAAVTVRADCAGITTPAAKDTVHLGSSTAHRMNQMQVMKYGSLHLLLNLALALHLVFNLALALSKEVRALCYGI
eukprot:6194522-Pleurochrysis_carterae.AAC.2